ncbi:hypothetical protein PC129_g20126, partial [Phytophthora cactorum]
MCFRELTQRNRLRASSATMFSLNPRQSMQSVLQSSGSSGSSIRNTATSFISAAYNSYESGTSFRNVDAGLVPSFEALNPYAKAGRSMMGDDKRWQPVPDLFHSKESLYFRSAVGKVLKTAHEEISPAELEVRANTPEFKVEEGDWIAHNSNQKNQFALITPLKTVARIPANLIISDEPISLTQHISNHMGGYLRKKGEKNKAFKKRYMELNGSVLAYYKKKPEKNGIPLSRDEKKTLERGRIDLDRVSSLQPMESKSEPYGILLVTTTRTWAICADSEPEYQRWLKGLCDVVKFSAVHVTYKRMFQLQEVSAKAITDVRMVVTTGDTVGQIVEHIFNCYEQALDAAPLRPYNPAEYRLKITGYRDYMIDRFRVLNEYVHVRECLLTKKTIRLTVIHESVIQETAMMNLSIGRDLPVSTGSMNNIVNQFADMFDGERATSLQMTTLGDEWERPSVDRNPSLPSEVIQQPFAIRIRRVLNIPRTTCVRKRSSEEAIVSRIPLTSSSVVVRIELYDGGQLLDNAVIDTSDVRLKAQRNDLLYAEWDDPVWHKFNIDICNVTRTMRVQLTVLGVKKIVGGSASNMDATEEKMLVTGVNAFEVDDVLVQGQQYVHMYNNLHSCVQGPVPHVTLPNEPMIQLEFSKFNAPIKFDWSDDDESLVSDRSHRRSIITSSRSVMLRKEGWLQKVGNFSSLTRWRRRWFVVDQSTCTLSYADDEAAPRKLITLRNCSVTTADDMNQKFTTAPVNKGTRKLRQTWCFKVRPMGSSRDYIISAETKQDREEWMLAIQTVAKGDSSISDFGSSFEDSTASLSAPVAESPRVEESISQLDGRNILESVAQDRRDSVSRSSGHSSYQREGELNELRKLILLDPLYRFSPYQKEQLWMHREEFIDIPAALPRILSCVHWDDRDECEEALTLLPRWSVPDHQAAYIELLNGEFAHEGVRTFAVQKLSQMADTTFSYFLPQLVQAIKFENHHVSPLAMLLIERAIKNPNQIGFDLFWSMKVEAHNDQYRERYGTILNAYLDVCSSKMRAILKLQDKLFSE